MDLNDFKRAWDQFSSNEKREELDEQALKKILQGRTKSLIEKVERNIRIGFGIIFLLIVLFIIDDFILSPILAKSVYENITIPNWLIYLSAFSYSFIILTFIYFVIIYYKAKKECDPTSELKKTLTKTIHILHIYQRIFYYGLFVLMLSSGINFIAGLYEGMVYISNEEGIPFNEFETKNIVFTIFIGLVVLLLITGGLFLFFRWGFRRLYGNHLYNMKQTLAELNEID